MEEFWDLGIDTKDIPPELVLHDLDNDVEDNEVVYLKQLDRLTSQQINLLEIQNDLQLSTSEMEANGIYVNRDILEENKLQLETQLTLVEEELLELMKPFGEFNPYSTHDVSRLLFGGEVKIKTRLPATNPDGTIYTFKSGRRKGEIKLVNHERTAIIKGLGFKPRDEWKMKKAGIFSTNESVLNKLLEEIKGEENETSKEISDCNDLDVPW